ncbi:uncharacterized protein LOC132310499 [Cornus florida]|uniref:uncharacterized protein LOC132310499 n=1 Tax=Cornus florida TaxID=4283 RepID=UPI0028A2B144|nr:uncharacterized protein LOC132310499 [Cornus florida]
MATKGKESGQGRERRGISPTLPHHHANTTQRRRSPNPSATASIDEHKDGATQPEKPRIPNYLRPTISSSHDPSMLTKKQTSNTAKKPLLNRRRSLDKPPSPSQLPKTRTSPSPVERNPRVLPKTTTKPKTQTDRLSKAPTKSHSFSSRSASAKKSSSTTIKNPNSESGSEATTKAPSSVSSTDVANSSRPDSEQEDQESSVSEVEKEIMLMKAERNNEVPTEISLLEENEDVDMVQVELENEEEDLLKPFDSSNILEDQIAFHLPGEMKDPVDNKVHVEVTSDDHHEVEEDHGTEESDKNHPEESFAGEPNVEESFVGEPKVEGEQKEGEEITSEKSEGKALDEKVDVGEKEEVDDGSQTLNSKEREEEESVAKEAKPEAKDAMAKSHGGQGKRDCQPSNDVIEETASKLLEKRKHKVQALVGAFETVISLQEPEA